MEKTKLIKNIGCFLGYILGLITYIVLLVHDDPNHLLMVILMSGMVFPLFSLSWSMKKLNSQRSLNLILILTGVVLSLIYVVSLAISSLRPELTGFANAISALAIIIAAYALGLLVYTLLLDIGVIRSKSIVKE